MSIAELYEIYRQYPQITTDSRNCPPQSVFFALKGGSFNGNQYALAALEKGCAYAVVDETEYAVNERIILVPDVLETLQQLAGYHRRQLNIPVIGITGTNGKTTTKELISSVLKCKYNTLYTQGNLNNHIGVPLTLLSLTKEHEIAVVEMGANHPGEIKILAEIACPDYGIITNVGKGHLEGFGSFGNVISTKGELYDYIRNANGKIFINIDNPYLKEISSGLDKIEYSLKENAFVYGYASACTPALEVSWQKKGDANTYLVKSNLIGTYNTENILAAICIGTYFGIAPLTICDALNSYIPQNNRSQLTRTKKNTLIIDAYNANPTSMEAAVQNFASIGAGKKMLILGDMKELGGESKDEHQKIVHLLEKSGFDKVYLVGSEFLSVKSAFMTFPVIDDVIKLLSAEQPEDYFILIKGSRSMKMEKVVDFL